MDIVEKDSSPTGSPILIQITHLILVTKITNTWSSCDLSALRQLIFQKITFSTTSIQLPPARPLKTSETVEEVDSQETTAKKYY